MFQRFSALVILHNYLCHKKKYGKTWTIFVHLFPQGKNMLKFKISKFLDFEREYYGDITYRLKENKHRMTAILRKGVQKIKG